MTGKVCSPHTLPSSVGFPPTRRVSHSLAFRFISSELNHNSASRVFNFFVLYFISVYNFIELHFFFTIWTKFLIKGIRNKSLELTRKYSCYGR